MLMMFRQAHPRPYGEGRWMTHALECRAFGELAVVTGGTPVCIGGPKQRLLLAVLLLRANSAVRTDELVETLWADQPPRTARKNLQVYVSKLRKVFGDRLTHTACGYRLGLDADCCDLLRFEQLIRAGRRAAREGDRAAARRLLGEAVAGWQGPPLTEFGDVPALAVAADRFQELYLSVLEDWAELELADGEHRLVLERTEEQARAHPLRERLAAVWMRALARSGRGNEALAHFDTVRRTLARELGVDPGPALAELHGRLLRGEGAARPAPSRPSAGACPGNQLPRDLPDFVGRATELHLLTGHLAQGSDRAVAVVCGPVGCGKSAFAVHAAHRLAAAFPDGGLLVELDAKPLAAAVRELLDMAGLDGGRSPAHALALWRSWIAERRLLLVLDNAAREDVVRALLPGSGPSGVIVTSRSRLSGLESVLRVGLPPLSDTEGVELLARIIGPDRVTADRPSAHRLLDCCEGSPLLVRIAGARLDALRHVRLADYADRLCWTPRLLDEMAVGGLALRTRYEDFYRTLSDRQRAAYHRVAALTPPFGHSEVIAALAGLADTAQLAVESLVECNLLTAPGGEVSAHSTVYGMSALAHGFAREQLAAEPLG